MYAVLHRILAVLYALLPVAACVWSFYSARKRRSVEPVVSFLVTCFSGVIVGSCIIVIYAVLFHGRVPAGQVLQGWYFLIGLLCVMSLFRWAVREGALRLLRVDRDPAGRPLNRGGVRASLAFLLQ